jgi:hypothetical protein
VMAVYESRESWERFRDDILTPGLAGVDDSLPSPPEEMTFESRCSTPGNGQPEPRPRQLAPTAGGWRSRSR